MKQNQVLMDLDIQYHINLNIKHILFTNGHAER